MSCNMKSKKIGFTVIIKTLFVFKYCICDTKLTKGVQDSIEGSIQLLTGINELLSTGKDLIDPINIASEIVSTAFHNTENTSSQTTNLHQLYDKYFSANDSTTQDENSLNDVVTPTSNYINNVLQDILSKYDQYKAGHQTTAYDESTNLATVSESISQQTESITLTTSITETKFPSTTKFKEESEAITEIQNIEVTNETISNGTFEKFLTVQKNICYKIKYGIESIKRSDLVILFMKFLEYEYLKSKESWERIKITTHKIWDSVVNEEPKSNSIIKLNNILLFLDKTKDQFKKSLEVLRKPFSLILRRIANRYRNKIKNPQEDNREFCEKFSDAEIKLKEITENLEKQFTKILDEKIKKKNEILENAKNNPDSLSYFSKETISKDIHYIKETIYSIYEYLKTAAVNRLQMLRNTIRV